MLNFETWQTMAGVCHVASWVRTVGARRHSSITSGFSNSNKDSYEMTIKQMLISSVR